MASGQSGQHGLRSGDRYWLRSTYRRKLEAWRPWLVPGREALVGLISCQTAVGPVRQGRRNLGRPLVRRLETSSSDAICGHI